MIGSVMTIRAASEAGARKWIADDIYGTSGVWNVEKATVLPVRCALLPLRLRWAGKWEKRAYDGVC